MNDDTGERAAWTDALTDCGATQLCRDLVILGAELDRAARSAVIDRCQPISDWCGTNDSREWYSLQEFLTNLLIEELDAENDTLD